MAILVTAEEKSLTVEDSQRVTVPVMPLNVNDVLFVPVHTVALPAMLPPTEAWFTVTFATVLFAGAHTPLVTTARNQVVMARPVAMYEADVAPFTLFQVELSVEDCHWIVPVLPLNDIVELLDVAHTVAAVFSVAVPPTEV